MNYFSFLFSADRLYPPFVTESFPIIRIVLIVLLLILSLGMIICVLFQTSTSSGIGAMAGQKTETFYSKNKGRTMQGLLKRLTIIFAISILVITILYLASVIYYPVNI